MANQTTFNPEFPEQITESPAGGSQQSFNPEVQLQADPMAALAEEAGLDENAIFEAMNVGQTIGRNLTNVEGIQRMLREREIADKDQSQALARLAQSRNVFQHVGALAAQLIGPRGEALQASHFILEGAAIAANAAALPDRLMNSPLGRALRGGGREARYRAYWNIVGQHLSRNLESQMPHPSDPPPLSPDPRLQGFGAQQRPDISMEDAGAFIDQTIIDQTRDKTEAQAESDVTMEDASATISELIRDIRLYPNRPEGATDPRRALSNTTPMPPDAEMGDVSAALEEVFRDMGKWQNYPEDAERTREQRERTKEIQRLRKDTSLNDVAGEDAHLQSQVINRVNTHSTASAGTNEADSVSLDYYSQDLEANIDRGEGETEAARAARQSGEYGDLNDVGREFLEWASHRLRWGNSYTHLFEVQILDSVGYARENPPPPIGGGPTNTEPELDFSRSRNTIRFACTGASIGGMELGMERTGGQDLPLPTSASVDQNITLNILDYTRMSLFNYFYAWWLNFYNPHKRRFVSGKEGKYKDIIITVQSWYGDYWPTDRGRGEDDSHMEGPPRQNDLTALNNRYSTVLTITAYNCILTSFPGMGLSWDNSEPFSFDVDLMPADVYYDFRNPQNYTARSARPHLNEIYDDQIRYGRQSPGEIRRAMGVTEDDMVQ